MRPGLLPFPVSLPTPPHPHSGLSSLPDLKLNVHISMRECMRECLMTCVSGVFDDVRVDDVSIWWHECLMSSTRYERHQQFLFLFSLSPLLFFLAFSYLHTIDKGVFDDVRVDDVSVRGRECLMSVWWEVLGTRDTIFFKKKKYFLFHSPPRFSTLVLVFDECLTVRSTWRNRHKHSCNVRRVSNE